MYYSAYILIVAFCSPSLVSLAPSNAENDNEPLSAAAPGDGPVGYSMGGMTATSCERDPCKKWGTKCNCCIDRCPKPTHCAGGDCGECCECWKDSDCKNPGLVCHGTKCVPACKDWEVLVGGQCVNRCSPFYWHEGQCVECTNDTECKPDHKCLGWKCVECTVTTDCKPDHRCNAQNECEPACDSCHLWDGEACSPKCWPYYCENSKCVECTLDTQCGTDATCVNGKCGPNCGPCQKWNGNSCENKCTPLGCNKDGDCVVCKGDGDCPYNGKCVDSNCVDCRVTDDCPKGECACCSEPSDCGVDKTCVEGKCLPSCSSKCQSYDSVLQKCTDKCSPLPCNDGACVQCNENLDCGKHEKCVDHKCVSDCNECQCHDDANGSCSEKCDPFPCLNGKCVECLGDSDCKGEDKKCLDNKCVQCKTNADCGPGLGCMSQRCEPICNGPCQRYDSVMGCQENKCSPLHCVVQGGEGVCKACVEDKNCQPGLRCENSQCQFPTQCCRSCENWVPGLGCQSTCGPNEHCCDGKCKTKP
ncbi:Teneurin-3 [Halotydeus destructor]|nr:Teneurin-3 [Halotydeus destructor]